MYVGLSKDHAPPQESLFIILIIIIITITIESAILAYPQFLDTPIYSLCTSNNHQLSGDQN